MTTPDFTTASDLDLCRYFIAKFEAIPEDKWREGSPTETNGRTCVLGHCGLFRDGIDYSNPTPEALALGTLLTRIPALARIHSEESKYSTTKAALMYPCWRLNDTTREHGFDQPTPRARVLAALRDIQTELESA